MYKTFAASVSKTQFPPFQFRHNMSRDIYTQIEKYKYIYIFSVIQTNMYKLIYILLSHIHKHSYLIERSLMGPWGGRWRQTWHVATRREKGGRLERLALLWGNMVVQLHASPLDTIGGVRVVRVAQHCVDTLGFAQFFKEWNEIQHLCVCHVVEPWCHRHLDSTMSAYSDNQLCCLIRISRKSVSFQA